MCVYVCLSLSLSAPSCLPACLPVYISDCMSVCMSVFLYMFRFAVDIDGCSHHVRPGLPLQTLHFLLLAMPVLFSVRNDGDGDHLQTGRPLQTVHLLLLSMFSFFQFVLVETVTTSILDDFTHLFTGRVWCCSSCWWSRDHIHPGRLLQAVHWPCLVL